MALPRDYIVDSPAREAGDSIEPGVQRAKRANPRTGAKQISKPAKRAIAVAFTVSQSDVERVRGYIARQKEHYQKISIRDEFIEFLNANGIQYDERFI